MGQHLFLQSVHMPMDKQGLVNEQIRVPPKDTKLTLDRYDADKWKMIVVAGGDGSVSTIAQQIVDRPQWHGKPILVVPAGVQNSIALGLGVGTPNEAHDAFISQDIREISQWHVTPKDGATGEIVPDATIGRCGENYLQCFGAMSLGALSNVYRDSRRLQLWTTQMMSVPQLRRRFSYVAAYTALMSELTPRVRLEITLARKAATARDDDCDDDDAHSDATADQSGAQKAEAEEKVIVIEDQLKMCHASRVPMQHSKFCLTPRANYEDDLLEVTLARKEASRSRIMHLFFREAAERRVIVEDGVEVYRASKVRVTALESDLELVIDGEVYVCGQGMSCELARSSGHKIPFFVGLDGFCGA